MNQNAQLTRISLIINCFIKAGLIVMNLFLFACSDTVTSYTEIKRDPNITPDYSAITIPPNIAPLNFTINEKAEKYQVKMYSQKGYEITIASANGNIRIPPANWKKLLEQCIGNDFFIDVYLQKGGSWTKFQTIVNHVAIDSLDKYLVYRLIDPGFETWNKMGIYQRNLENYDEKPIMINRMSDGNCINCHSFCMNNSHTMLFHMRKENSGTIIYRNGEMTKVNTKTDQTISPGVYPAWHPNGRIIAFSVNSIIQQFHAIPDKKVEIIDLLSDLILFDAETNTISSCNAIASTDRLETFPSWSPDGNFLYYCSAKALPPDENNHIRYDLLRIAYDQGSCQFGAVDTIISSSRTGFSISFPRISPDGKYLLFCVAGYGNFTIWHKEADLYLMNLETNEITKPDINSNQTESYHTWSSTGRWLVFSSRRIDGLFTRPYFAYFDVNGKAHKPFLLPQKNPRFYDTFLKSYNIPELVKCAVEFNPRDLMEIVKSVPINATFKNN